MNFIGQNHIMRQLKFLLPALYEDKARGINFLLRGPSGYGKTTMAISIAEYLAGRGFEYYLGSWTEFRLRKRVIFIDEVHLMKDYEILFPEMDKAFDRSMPNAHVFIFATNQSASLPEAFSNRCLEFIFDDYSDDELLLIARGTARFSAPDFSFLQVVEAGNRNPRIVKSLVDRLGTFFIHNMIDPQTADFSEILAQVFSIQDGLDTLCRRYLEVLEDVGGTASISLLKNILHVDQGTLTNTVEPVLLRKGMIKISPKGRVLL